MSDQETADLRERLAALEKSNPRNQPKARPAAKAAKMAGLLCGGVAIAGLVYVYSLPDGAADMTVREAQEFQNEGSGFGDLQNPRPPCRQRSRSQNRNRNQPLPLRRKATIPKWSI